MNRSAAKPPVDPDSLFDLPPRQAAAPGVPSVSDPASPFDPRRRAKALFWMGWGVAEIGRELGIPYNTLASWKRRDKWAL